MTKSVTLRTSSTTRKISNCVDCPHHKVLLDPDPDDWFCDDDVKVVCLKANRTVTTSCRPYSTRKECSIPSWCPLRPSKDGKGKKSPASHPVVARDLE